MQAPHPSEAPRQSREDAFTRVPLRERDELSIYWDNHLRVAFAQSAPHDLPAMVEASMAHVIMLRSTGALSVGRSRLLLRGLVKLWEQWGPGATHTTWAPRVGDYPFDGSVEDPYYFLEQQLAAACNIDTADLDVQLARSRNDLDAAVFRMILRRGILDVADLLLQTASDLATQAARLARVVIVGQTHRRPAQPTTIGHVLSGLAETLISQAQDLLSVYDEMNVSPLGAAAFTGTDIAIDARLVAELLGFDRSFTASYEAVAGAEHFMRLAAVLGRITATGSRWARVLQEWMSQRWVETPTAFTQGSSIMPQKKNPVVLEHMVSMASASNAEMLAVYSTIAAGWYEDSNNATTDVQKNLWTEVDRVVRFLRLYDGLIEALEVDTPPTTEQIVQSGATTTAVAEALALRGVPWRAAHHVVATLFKAGEPSSWTREQVTRALLDGGIEDSNGELAELTLTSGRDPHRVLDRNQPGSPGVEPVKMGAAGIHRSVRSLRGEFVGRRRRLDGARAQLEHLARSGTHVTGRLSVVGNTNLDVIVHGVSALPAPGTESIVDSIEIRVGGSAAITAQRAAQLGVRTQLVSKVADDAPSEVVSRLVGQTPGLTPTFVWEPARASGLTVAIEADGRDRSFLSTLGAMGTFSPDDVPRDALDVDMVLASGYFLLPEMQGERLAELLRKAKSQGAQTALDTGDPDEGWTVDIRRELLDVVLPHVDYFLPNEAELLGLTGLDDPERAAASLAVNGGPVVVAKLGSKGALVHDGRSARRFRAPRVEPVDTTGAGDSFNAALLSELLRGASLDSAVSFAVETASKLVATPSDQREALLTEIRSGGNLPTPAV